MTTRAGRKQVAVAFVPRPLSREMGVSRLRAELMCCPFAEQVHFACSVETLAARLPCGATPLLSRHAATSAVQRFCPGSARSASRKSPRQSRPRDSPLLEQFSFNSVVVGI